MNRRSSKLRASLPCPRCGRSLVPSTTGASVRFHCKSGHELELRQILDSPSAALKVGLESLLLEWQEQHRALMDIIDDATRRGHVDVAAIFGRHARSLEARIDILKDAFVQSDSAKLLRIPSSIRKN